MSANTYIDLPLDTVYKLLIVAVQDMITASESNKQDAIIEFRAKKKQVEQLMLTIEEKQAMNANRNSEFQ